MLDVQDCFRLHLLNDFQRGFPVVDRPFAVLAKRLGVAEGEVLDALSAFKRDGAITRVGAVVRPNTAGASTLAAMAVPATRLAEVASWLSGLKGVNHSYLREDAWNLWFVVTAPDVNALETDLAKISAHTGLRVLDLRLVRPFHIDLGFDLKGESDKYTNRTQADMAALRDEDRPLLHALSQGLPLVSRPYAALADSLGSPSGAVMARIEALIAAGIISRLGVVVRHRHLGWQENAMVVWDVPFDEIEVAGEALAQLRGVSLCYQRRTEPGLWPYRLYCMIHARSRPEAQVVIDAVRSLPLLETAPYKVLFSTHCYKQTGANLQRQEAAA